MIGQISLENSAPVSLLRSLVLPLREELNFNFFKFVSLPPASICLHESRGVCLSTRQTAPGADVEVNDPWTPASVELGLHLSARALGDETRIP